jgi:hypothetical protein
MASKADDAAVRMLLDRSRSSIADGDKDDALAAARKTSEDSERILKAQIAQVPLCIKYYFLV